MNMEKMIFRNKTNVIKSKISIKETEKRNNLYDVLRLIGIIGVIIIHVTAENMYGSVDKNTLINNFYNSLVHSWAVPLFITISGALILTKPDLNIIKVYKKYIPRILFCFIFWHFFYYYYQNRDFNIIRCLNYFVTGNTYPHLWYLYLMLGFYIISPILKRLADNLNQKELIYLLSIGFFINSFIPTLNNIFDLDLSVYFDSLLVLKISPFIFYYLLGYYLSKYNVKHYKIMFALFILLIILLSVYQNTLSVEQNVLINYSTNTNILAIFFIVPVFTIAKKYFNERYNKKIEIIGSLTFGVYLIHFIVEKIFFKFGIYSNMINPVVGVPLTVLIVTIISYFISFIIYKIPYVNKIIK